MKNIYSENFTGNYKDIFFELLSVCIFEPFFPEQAFWFSDPLHFVFPTWRCQPYPTWKWINSEIKRKKDWGKLRYLETRHEFIPLMLSLYLKCLNSHITLFCLAGVLQYLPSTAKQVTEEPLNADILLQHFSSPVLVSSVTHAEASVLTPRKSTTTLPEFFLCGLLVVTDRNLKTGGVMWELCP